MTALYSAKVCDICVHLSVVCVCLTVVCLFWCLVGPISGEAHHVNRWRSDCVLMVVSYQLAGRLKALPPRPEVHVAGRFGNRLAVMVLASSYYHPLTHVRRDP